MNETLILVLATAARAVRACDPDWCGRTPNLRESVKWASLDPGIHHVYARSAS